MLRFVKGHGTENDFVLLPDPDGALELSPSLARALCDRRAGLGADGVMRVVRESSGATGAEWFMDYRNADGSVAEMCGNGIRVYARYLVAAGLAPPGVLRLGTRDGVKEVHLGPEGDVTVEMAPAKVLGTSAMTLGGVSHDGIRVDMGNPHLVCAVDGPLDRYDLSRPPGLDAGDFPDGGNVEILTSAGDRHIAMRVHERGVGETRSCGTGACAAAVATASRTADAGGDWTVDVPGGRLRVALEGESVRLSGPAVIVATGHLDDAWLVAVAG